MLKVKSSYLGILSNLVKFLIKAVRIIERNILSCGLSLLIKERYVNRIWPKKLFWF